MDSESMDAQDGMLLLEAIFAMASEEEIAAQDLTGRSS
jgi:hypothetical protein